MAATQEGDELAVYMLERNFDSGLAEIRRGSWTPSGGIDRGVSFGGYSAGFGGTLQEFPGGATITGLSDVRYPDVRVATKSGLAAFPNGEIAFTCEGTMGSWLAVYADGGLAVFKSNENCGALQCRYTLAMSPTVDGGRFCLLEDKSLEDVGYWMGVGFDAHPSMRVVGISDYPFIEIDDEGRTVAAFRAGPDSGMERGGRFWPTDKRPPTRVLNEYATKFAERYDPTGVPRYYTWVDGGVVRSDTPFSKYMTYMEWMRELPTGVVIRGNLGDGGSMYSKAVGVLADPTGEKVLGTFRGKDGGFSCAPNAYVEGRYFHQSTLGSQKWAEDDRKHAELMVSECEFVPVAP